MKVENWRLAIGTRLKSLRQNSPFRYTRKDLVEVLDRMYAVSVTESHIAKIESGQSFPGYELLFVLRKHFDTDFNFILGEEQLKRPELPDFLVHHEFRELFERLRRTGLEEKEVMDLFRQLAAGLTGLVAALDPTGGGEDGE